MKISIFKYVFVYLKRNMYFGAKRSAKENWTHSLQRFEANEIVERKFGWYWNYTNGKKKDILNYYYF